MSAVRSKIPARFVIAKGIDKSANPMSRGT